MDFDKISKTLAFHPYLMKRKNTFVSYLLFKDKKVRQTSE
ncbi:hypothetical protein RV14_GL002298 [Enterococcus ratti]|uniref:Uncharacterized protein n=1 Tax=Enterococcus ratti TaxID=150033 RepID=A0A1L8WNX0_9ENTE|nr:hypothetical protein RV14_GL002298 [Enterococcus ratti]